MAIKIIHEVRVTFVPGDGDEEDRELLHNIFSLTKSTHNKTTQIIMTQTEMAEKLDGVTTKLVKVGEESKKTLQAVADLKEQLANQENVSPELQASFDRLEAQATVVDDLVPDPVVEPPVEGGGL